MNGRFILGILLGVALGVIAIAGGGYFYLTRGSDRPTDPTRPAVSESKIAELLKPSGQAGQAGELDITVALKIPSSIQAKLPSRATLIAQLNAADPSTLGGASLAIAVSGNKDWKFRFRPPVRLVSGQTYRLAMVVCPGPTGPCDFGRGLLEARAFFHYDEKTGPSLDLGTIFFTRLYARESSCYGSDTLISGKVEATPEFTSRGGKSYVLVFTNSRQASGLVPGLVKNPADGDAYKDDWFYEAQKPVEQHIVQAVPLELKGGSATFTVPNPGKFEGNMNAYVVTCDKAQSVKDCAPRAFPLPATANSVTDRVYRLVAKDFVVARCGMKDLLFHLHAFPPRGAPRTNTKLPAEVIEGAYY